VIEEVHQEEGIYEESVLNALADHAYLGIEVTTIDSMAVTRAL
jgi:hypothetical protein